MSNEAMERAFTAAVEKEGQEYLAARRAVRDMKPDVEALLRSKAQNPDWRVARTAEILLGWRMYPELYEQLAADVRAEWAGKEGSKPISGQVDANRRAMVIAQQHGSQAVPRLLEMVLKSGEADKTVEQDAALLAVGYLRDHRAFEPLLSLLSAGTDMGLRRTAVLVLGMLQDHRAVEPLIILLQSPAEPVQLRRDAVTALVRLRATRATGPFQAVLLDESENPALRQQSADALGQLGDSSATHALARTAETTGSWDLAYFCLLSLGRVGNRSALPVIESLQKRYADALMQETAQAAKAAIEARD